MPEEVEQRAGDASLLERMLGLRSGHGGGLAEVLGDGLVTAPTPAELRSAIETAGEAEYELARRMVDVLVTWAEPLLQGAPGRAGDPA